MLKMDKYGEDIVCCLTLFRDFSPSMRLMNMPVHHACCLKYSLGGSAGRRAFQACREKCHFRPFMH